MQNAKTATGRYMFEIDEWLTVSQVRSYFSRMKAANMKKIGQLPFSGASQHATFTNNEDEQELDLDDEANDEVYN